MASRLLTVIMIFGLVAAFVALRPVEDMAEEMAEDRLKGNLRCEGRGAIVINIAGKDYAVNGMASSRYPPIQRVGNRTTYPETVIDRLILDGIMLCKW